MVLYYSTLLFMVVEQPVTVPIGLCIVLGPYVRPSCVCPILACNSEQESGGKFNFGAMVSNGSHNLLYHFKVKRLEVKVTRSHNAQE